ncbi:MAG TPA: Uma2 family endonuclease [Isosphaeraceae bacterium]|jgi:Uma2 family endonuclease|nr:Uma2 family endonuclease [Isosphaeraceae bacterium]
MATDVQAVPTPMPDAPPPPADDARLYDRSSLPFEGMVTLSGQSEEDFWVHAPEKQYCEYIDGVVYMPSPVSAPHQDEVGFLFWLLHTFRLERGTGRVTMGPEPLRLGPGRVPEPDVFVRPVGWQGGQRDEPPDPPAVLVIEILSPSTRYHDLNLKAKAYQDAKVPDIWFVDGRDKVVVAYRREGDGYRVDRVAQGRLTCSALAGFWIDAAWLWADPLPDPRRCLAAILAGPAA